ncbi:DUF1778 domain-containing protein [Inhella sp.]|uniref:type II toxin -antitoxin system TacA 1-like antitoxin n=1 Tax=Inhella sp. TaxID=1921806 RepID=UPI0035ADC45D
MELKTETLNLRVTPAFKDLVREAAEREHRSISNFIEVLVREHCDRLGIGIGQELTKQPPSR